jgi:hypothetical protein
VILNSPRGGCFSRQTRQIVTIVPAYFRTNLPVVLLKDADGKLEIGILNF